MTGNTSIKHNSVDRVLMRVGASGACSPEEIRDSCNLGTGIVLRGATILQTEGLLSRRGVGRSTMYEVTDLGREAISRLRRGGSRKP